MTDESITFRQLTDPNDHQFTLVVQHQYQWWAEEFAVKMPQVELYMRHTLCADVPYTYVMEQGEELIGFYQVILSDLFTRPDLGPWFGFAYILPAYRHQGHFRTLMSQVPVHARSHGLRELYLHTRHEGLYEKFGWQLLESSPDYKPDGITRRIYRLKIP